MEENVVLVAWGLCNESSGKQKEGEDLWQDLLVSRALLGGSSKPRDEQVGNNTQGNSFVPFLLAALTPGDCG